MRLETQSYRAGLLSTLAVAVVIIILRFNTLHDPPYWDAAIGAWGEASEIVEKNFDIKQHLFEEPMWLQGGEAVYRFSFAVYALAIGMTILSTPHLIVVMHIVSLIIAALIAVTFYASMRKIVGFGPALLSTIAMMTSPLLSTQFDMIGIDLPPMLLGWVAVTSCVNRKYTFAAVVSLLAFFSKHSGMIYILAIVGFLVVRLLSTLESKHRDEFKSTLIGLAINAVSLIVQWSTLTYFFPRGSGENWRALTIIPYWCPDITVLFLVAILGFATCCILDRKRGESLFSSLHQLTNRHGVLFMSLILLVLLIGGLTRVYPVPRYLVYGYQPLFALFTGVLFWRRDQALLGMKVLIGIIIINLVNWNGLLYPSPDACGQWAGSAPGVTSREGSFFDRSRAYRADLREVRKAIAVAQKDGSPVVAGGAFANYLTSPRLGYVKTPQHGYLSDGLRDSYHAMKSAGSLLEDLPRELVFIYCPTSLTKSFPLFEMPTPIESDQILYSSGGQWPIVVFKRRWDSSVSDKDLTYWFADRLWPIPNSFTDGSPSEVNTPRYQIKRLMALGRMDLARWVVNKALRKASSEKIKTELKALNDLIDNASNVNVPVNSTPPDMKN